MDTTMSPPESGALEPDEQIEPVDPDAEAEEWPEEAYLEEPRTNSFGRQQQAAIMRIEKDGTVTYGAEAIEAMNGHFEASAFSGIRRDVGHGPETPEEFRRRTRRPDHLARRPESRPIMRMRPIVRPREHRGGRTPVPTCGSRRTTGSGETSSGEDGGGGEGEPSGDDFAGRLLEHNLDAQPVVDLAAQAGAVAAGPHHPRRRELRRLADLLREAS
jgi:hypothetical protein